MEFPEKWNRDIRLFPHDRVMARTLLPLIPRWTYPNHITLVRFILTPVVVFLLWQDQYWAGVPLFVIAALTDAVDGSLARVRRQITEWGIIYDPLADKLLVGSVLLVVAFRYLNLYLAAALLFVEIGLAVGGWYAKTQGQVRPANLLGKTKMLAECVGITCLLVGLWIDVDVLRDVAVGALAFAIVAALGSAVPRLFERRLGHDAPVDGDGGSAPTA